MYCSICLPKYTTASFLWRSQVFLHPALPSYKEPFKAELRLTGHTRAAANSLGAHLCLERWHVLLISEPYDDPPPPPLLPVWIQMPNPQRKRERERERGRDVVETQPLGRVEVNEDICLAICKLLKQLKTVKIDESKLLSNEGDNQKHCLKCRGRTKPLKKKKTPLNFRRVCSANIH